MTCDLGDFSPLVLLMLGLGETEQGSGGDDEGYRLYGDQEGMEQDSKWP